MSRAAPHENVRIKAYEFLKKVYRKKLEEGRMVSPKPLLDFLRDIGAEDFQKIFIQEVYVNGERVDAVLGNIAFSFKSYEREFEKAKNEGRDRYLQKLTMAEYYVITNFDKWSIYKVERRDGQVSLSTLAEIVDLREAASILEQIMPPKVPATPKIVEAFFTYKAGDELVKPLKEALEEALQLELATAKRVVTPLYEAYKKIMILLYGNASEDLFKELFVKHTVMHMIVLAGLSEALGIHGDPIDICSGLKLEERLGFDIALPYLSWWKIVLNELKRTRGNIEKVVNTIVSKTSCLEWDIRRAEDVFRILYEILIEPMTRRMLGEYYTPLWVVELILSKFNLKDKVVFDPFSGSGTFLVMAFHRKVDLGEDPGKAFSELVGLDINPLAVAVARAELILAYLKRAGGIPSRPPAIYHADTLASWFTIQALYIPDPIIHNMFVAAVDFLKMKGYKNAGLSYDPREALEAVKIVEKALARSLRYALVECKINEECLSKRIEERLEKDLGRYEGFPKAFLEHFRNKIGVKLAGLVVKYKGNSVWSSLITSIYVPFILQYAKPHIIVTNPPWIPVTEFKAEYAGNVRNYMLSFIKNLGIPKSGSVLVGSDIAQAALSKSLQIAREGVGYVMNREQAFYHKTSMRAGIIATYSILKNFRGEIELTDINYDAFNHGIYPALVIAKKSEESKRSLKILRTKRECGKEEGLVTCPAEYQDLGKNYDNYIAPALAYFTGNLNVLAVKLGVTRIMPQGLFIRGIYGGERKEGAGEYAGLAVEEYGFDDSYFYFRLYNTKTKLLVPQDWLRKKGVNVYSSIYRGKIKPFVVEPINIILSSKGSEELRNFLKEALKAGVDKINEQDREKIETLIDELKQPSKIETLKKEDQYYYVTYRCARAFTAAFVDPREGFQVIESHVAALECDSREKALYYTAVLNYLAYKAVEMGRSFVRDQFARPAFAIAVAGLSWDDVPDDVRKRVVELAERLIEKLKVREWEISGRKTTQDKVLENLYREFEEFKKIVEILDRHVEDLEEALDYVTGVSGSS